MIKAEIHREQAKAAVQHKLLTEGTDHDSDLQEV